MEKQKSSDPMLGSEFMLELEAGAFTRIGHRALQKRRFEGTGPAFIRAGKRVIYARVDLLSWMARHRCEQGNEEVQAAAAA